MLFGITKKASDSFTRPADTTAYAANDEVSNSTTQASAEALNFANVAKGPTGSGYVVGGKLVTSGDTVASGSFRLWLFTAAPTMVGDNAPYGLLNSEREEIVGYLDFTLETEDTTAGDTAVAFNHASRIPFQCALGDADLYGVLVAEAAYTPGNAQTYYVELLCEDN